MANEKGKPPVVPGAATETKKEKSTETKDQTFKRLASARTRSVLKSIRILANCSSGNYDYTQDQVDSIFGTIQKALDSAKSGFQPKAAKSSEPEFSL